MLANIKLRSKGQHHLTRVNLKLKPRPCKAPLPYCICKGVYMYLSVLHNNSWHWCDELFGMGCLSQMALKFMRWRSEWLYGGCKASAAAMLTCQQPAEWSHQSPAAEPTSSPLGFPGLWYMDGDCSCKNNGKKQRPCSHHSLPILILILCMWRGCYWIANWKWIISHHSNDNNEKVFSLKSKNSHGGPARFAARLIRIHCTETFIILTKATGNPNNSCWDFPQCFASPIAVDTL